MRIEALSRWTSEQRHVVAATFLGWTLDAFDFFLLVFVLKDIAAEFHSDITEVTFAILLTLAMRPLGAYLFGRAADRWGRRPTLMVDVLLYSAIEFASGFAPSLTALLILRAIFGVAIGGEWGVGASLTMESIPLRARGLVSGLLQSGYPAGYFLASIVYGSVPIYRLARHVHGRRHSGAPGVLHPPQGSGIAKLATDHSAHQYVRDRARALAARHLCRRADDGIQFLQPRHAGSLPDLPSGPAWIFAARGRADRGHLQYRRHCRRPVLRRDVRTLWPPAHHHPHRAAFACGVAAMGIFDHRGVARRRRLFDAGDGAGRLGRHSGALERIIAG